MASITTNNEWGRSWPSPPAMDEDETTLISEAKKRFKACIGWEAIARLRFDYDYKFANADTHNKYQWEDKWITKRETEDRPCLTINKTQVHNLLIINDAKQNKPGVRIRPVGDEATFEAAQIFQEIIYHIEYISNAENIYDNAVSFQVQAGIGYWRVVTEYISPNSFDQEIYIRRVKDPRSVYLDPNINEQDGSDAAFGFIFDDMSKDLFRAKYPKFAGIADRSVLGDSGSDGWITQDNVRVCEYYRKLQKEDKLVSWTNLNREQILKLVSELEEIEQLQYKEIKNNKEAKKLYQYQERKVVLDDIQWFKIAGDRIIDTGIWLGKYIPIVRVVGTETVINGELDRKGNTRGLINAQQMYNVNTSANIEFTALQSKSPYVAPAAAIEGYEEYYKVANKINHSYLPYNHRDEEGKEIPPPKREQPPKASPAYVQAMKIAQEEMMMASGQYQSQFGEAENAKSGVAINARQRQGDRATYHFLDNQAIAIRYTGKILIDLIPKIYDTKRVMQITTIDGREMRVTVDPEAKQAYQKGPDIQALNKKIQDILFNPNIGMYDLMADTGPSFATRRMEAFNALTQIAAQNKDFMNIGGDLLWQVADFPEADILAQRWRKIIPENIIGDGPDPQVQQMMKEAGDKIEQLIGMVQKQSQEIADKAKELEIKEREIGLKEKEVAVAQQRLDYDAETKRLTALGNAGPGISIEQIQPVIKQLIVGMIANGEFDGNEITLPGPNEGGTPIEPNDDQEHPPIEGAKKAPDGNWYVEKEQGQFYKVENNGGTQPTL